jgi:hypothetical protein
LSFLNARKLFYQPVQHRSQVILGTCTLKFKGLQQCSKTFNSLACVALATILNLAQIEINSSLDRTTTELVRQEIQLNSMGMRCEAQKAG